MNAKTYQASMKKMQKLDDALSRALDRLVAAREEGRPDQVTPARLAAKQLERELDSALHEARHAHREYWRDQARALRLEAVSTTVPVLVRYRHAMQCTGDITPLGLGMFEASVDDAFRHADLQAEVPAGVPDSAAMDRADEILW